MNSPKVCAVVVSNDPKVIKVVSTLADLFEVRIDLIGEEWRQLTKQLDKPWIACNRLPAEGGQWQGSEARRIETLMQAVELGAHVIDIELNTENLENVARLIRKTTKLLLSYHDLEKTPSLDEMKGIVRKQIKAGADICKVVTTAREFGDNLTALQLIREFPDSKIISFCMGPSGSMSRVLCPLVGGEFTYAAMERGKESARGQMTISEMRRIYGMITE